MWSMKLRLQNGSHSMDDQIEIVVHSCNRADWLVQRLGFFSICTADRRHNGLSGRRRNYILQGQTRCQMHSLWLHNSIYLLSHKRFTALSQNEAQFVEKNWRRRRRDQNSEDLLSHQCFTALTQNKAQVCWILVNDDDKGLDQNSEGSYRLDLWWLTPLSPQIRLLTLRWFPSTKLPAAHPRQQLPHPKDPIVIQGYLLHTADDSGSQSNFNCSHGRLSQHVEVA